MDPHECSEIQKPASGSNRSLYFSPSNDYRILWERATNHLRIMFTENGNGYRCYVCGPLVSTRFEGSNIGYSILSDKAFPW